VKRHVLVFIALLLPLAGCNDDVDVEPVAASGGTLCVTDFEQCVNPIFDAVIMGKTGQTTCSGSGCHEVGAGSGGAFKIFANAQPGSPEILSNFFAAKGFANLDEPDKSKILLEPLQGESSISGTHTGGDIFPTTGDACYQAVFQWASTRVSDTDSESCGICATIDTSVCGY
jgi:hypothetical protein